jgi:diguanylate cyclase (GGDEF)-like protein/putative nucleotidyltransferase with HDIG domain
MKKSNRERVLLAYRFLLIGAGILIVAFSAAKVVDAAFEYRWVVLTMFAVLGGWAVSSKIPGIESAITVSDAFVFLTMLLLGPEYAILLVAASTASDSFRYVKRLVSVGKRVLLIAMNIAMISCSYFISFSITNWIFSDLRLLAHQKDTFIKYAVALVFLACTQTLVNSLLIIAIDALKTKNSMWKIWRDNYSWVMVTYFSGIITATTVNALIYYFGFGAVVFIIPVLLMSYLIARPYIQNIEATKKHVEELNALHMRTLEAFATAVDAKDQITHEHVKRVQIYAEGLANLLGLPVEDTQALHAGALLHDIGKIAVPDYILNKPGKLTAAEFDKMKIHTIVGAQILERISFPYPLVPVVRHHHERWDGNGYPDGLKGEEIPITARILTVVDCFDAVREDRQYRKGLTRDQAIEFLIRDKGKHYDPQIVDLFIENLPKFEAQVATIKKGTLAFSPVQIEETEAIRKALPAAGLMAPAETEKSIEYLQTIRAAHQSSQEILSLYEIAQLFNSSLDVQSTIPTAVKHLESLISFDTCVVYLLDEYGGCARAHYATGVNAENFSSHIVNMGEGVTGWVLANNSTFANTDPKLDLTFLGEKGEKYRTLAVHPLVSNNRKFGAISLYSQSVDAYTEQHLRGFEQVANLFADALRNAAIFNEVKSQAMTDLLTGLPNLRYLRSLFEMEDDRPLGDKLPMTLIMMDIDCFKKVNEAVGRSTGDKALRETADLIRAQLRRDDVLVRYTNDKFVALLKGATPEAIADVAVRIQSTLFDFQPAVLEATDMKLRISIGQAHQGQDGYLLDELIEISERRLLSDKAARRALNEFEVVELVQQKLRTYTS